MCSGTNEVFKYFWFDKREVRPSLDAVNYLLQLHGDALKTSTDSGHMPLFTAAMASSSEDVIWTLLKAYPEAIRDMQRYFDRS